MTARPIVRRAASAGRFPRAAARLVGALAGGLLFCAGPASAQSSADGNAGLSGPGERTWVLRMPLEDPVTFNGALGTEGVGVGGAPMLYPAPNVAGFFAAVITHGLIVEGQKSKRAKELQASADKVLEPYRPALGNFTHAQLAQAWLGDRRASAAKELVGAGDPIAADGWLVDALPVFTMAQDQRTLTLDLLVSVRAPGHGEKAPYQRRVSLLSNPRMEPDGANSWLAGGARTLKDTSSEIFTDALNIAIRMMGVDLDKLDTPFRTIRYMEGPTEKMERAQLLEARCGRMLIKTLRGTLMSVPSANPETTSCSQS